VSRGSGPGRVLFRGSDGAPGEGVKRKEREGRGKRRERKRWRAGPQRGRQVGMSPELWRAFAELRKATREFRAVVDAKAKEHAEMLRLRNSKLVDRPMPTAGGPYRGAPELPSEEQKP
jgi:hypothetical protein